LEYLLLDVGVSDLSPLWFVLIRIIELSSIYHRIK
jgi:hypothetical protein